MRASRVLNLATQAVMTSNITTAGQTLEQAFGFSLQANITSSALVSGTLKLQASLDNANWADIAGTTQTISATGVYFYNVTDVMYPWVRAVWADSGSDASAKMNILFFYRGV